jgi:hypothetical protein
LSYSTCYQEVLTFVFNLQIIHTIKEIVMKKLFKIAAVAMLGFTALVSSGVNAATATGTFNVNINLTALCTVATIGDVTLNYTSLGAEQTGNTSASITCTNGVPYTLSLSTPPATDAITGIAYTTALTGTIPAAGTGSAQSVAITVTAAAGQAGNCIAPGTWTASVCSNGTAAQNAGKVQTLTVTY